MLFSTLLLHVSLSAGNVENLGIYDLLLQSTSIFRIQEKTYILENVICDYHDHWGMYNSQFAKKSYSRIVDFQSGEVVTNITASLGHSHLSAVVASDNTLHLFGMQADGCHREPTGNLMPTHWSSDDPKFLSWHQHHMFTPDKHLTDPHISVTYTADSQEYYMVSGCFEFSVASYVMDRDWAPVEGAQKPPNVRCHPYTTYFLTFHSGYFYLFHSLKNIRLFRTLDFARWEPSPANPIIQPDGDDVMISEHFRLGDSVETLQGFMKMQQYPKNWDFSSSDLSVCCLESETEGTILMWKGSTHGTRAKSPVPSHMNAAIILGKSDLPMTQFLPSLFSDEYTSGKDVETDESKPWENSPMKPKPGLNTDDPMVKAKMMEEYRNELEKKQRFDERFKNFNATYFDPFKRRYRGRSPFQRGPINPFLKTKLGYSEAEIKGFGDALAADATSKADALEKDLKAFGEALAAGSFPKNDAALTGKMGAKENVDVSGLGKTLKKNGLDLTGLEESVKDDLKNTAEAHSINGGPVDLSGLAAALNAQGLPRLKGLPPALAERMQNRGVPPMRADYKKDLSFLKDKKFSMKNSVTKLGIPPTHLSSRAKAQREAMLDKEMQVKRSGWLGKGFGIRSRQSMRPPPKRKYIGKV